MQRDQAIVFVFGLIFNQGIQSQLAWHAPHALKQRLNLAEYDLAVLEAIGPDALLDALTQPTALHRFTRTMAANLTQTIQFLNRNYDGDPRLLWQGQTPDAAFQSLLQLRGIGKHKAIQALFLLEAMGELAGPIPDAYYAHMQEKCHRFLPNIQQDIALILGGS